ncbi:MAG TPA: response regulator [Halanaerobiales bacterium]|nr:response regulator [Halanaerobiales bacterium]
MLKLMIAEDELLERKALRFLLNKYYREKIEIVAEVTNGEDAYARAVKGDMDIILMDIKMPGMDGLKAAELIKKKISETEIVVLTAHSEFEYAQKSIHIGLSDYLVKPYLEKEFCSVLDKSIKKIKIRNSRMLKQQELKEKLKAIIPLLEKEIILEFIYGTDDLKDKFMEYKKMLEINSNRFMCMVLSFPEKNIFNQGLLEKVKSTLREKIEGVIAYIGLQDMVFLLLEDDLNEIVESNEFRELLFELKDELKYSFHTDVQIGRSQVYDSPEKLSRSYDEARAQLINKGIWAGTYLYDREKVICSKIIARDLDGVLNEFNDLFSCLVNGNHKNAKKVQDYFREFIIFLDRSIKEYSEADQEIFNVRKVERDIIGFKNIINLKSYMHNFLKKLVKQISEHRKDKKDKIIEMVKDYINHNYNEDFSLCDVAEYISFSQYYLCRLFKEVEGINFKEYVIRVRMEKAKEMLKKGEMIKRVANSVGYSDPNYFSRAFKTYTGISPSKYV